MSATIKRRWRRRPPPAQARAPRQPLGYLQQRARPVRAAPQPAAPVPLVQSSEINPIYPVYGTPTTQSVRDNFAAAETEINTLFDEVSKAVQRGGDTMEGPLKLFDDATTPLEAVTLQQMGAALPITLPPAGPAGGDLTGSYPDPVLKNVNPNVGTFQGLVLNAKGLVTSATTVAYLTGNQTITLSGDATGSGATSIAVTLVNSGATAGTYNNVTVNAKGLVTSGSNAAYLTGNQTIALTGDTTGSGTTSIPSTTVALQGRPVAATAPTTNQVLQWNGSTWLPATLVGGGTVTSITAGTGLSGGTITNAGTIALANTAVSPAAYTYASLTVDAQGRLTAASSGTAPASKASTVPVMNGTAAIGALNTYATADHIHPVDTSRAPATGSTAYVAKGGDTMTGLLTVPALTASGSDVTNITAPANQYAIIRYNNHRQWWAGNTNTGNWVAYDVTAGRTMLTLDSSGNVTTPALYATYLSTSGDAVVANQLSINGQYGLRFGSNTWFKFSWDGNFVNAQLDGGSTVNLATTTWVNNNYVTRRICYQLGLDYSTNWYYGSTDGGSWFYARVEFITCDERIKTRVAPTRVDALATLCALPVEEWTTKPEVVKWFGLNKDKATRQRLADNAFVRIGITAQRAKEVDPGLVYVADQSKPIEGKPKGSPLPDDLLQCDSASFMPYFVRAIQQLNDKIDALEARLAQ